MRTTVDLPDDLLRVAKEYAVRRGESLSRVVQRALRAHLDASERSGGEGFELLVAGTPGGRAPTAEEIDRLLEADEWRAPR